MQKLLQSGLLMSFALAMSACALSGKVAKPICPKPTEVPASLMQAPTTGTKVRAELFEPQMRPTRK